MSIGKRIKKYRKSAQITQMELSKKANISRTYLSDIENERYNPSVDTLNIIAKSLNINVANLLNEQSQNLSFKVPVFASVSAGNPLLTNDEILDYEELPIEWKNQGEFYGVRIQGDSMLPRFASGDIVIVRKQNDIDNGGLAIVLVNGDEATFKQVKKSEHGITLIGYNTVVYSPTFYTNKDINTLPVQIIGEVVEVRVKIK